MLELPVMFFVFEFLGDMVFVLKIFILLSIISFIMNHLGKGPLAAILVIGFSYFMLFSPLSWFFETTYVLMMLLTMGAAGILIDFFFVGGGSGGGEPSPVSSGSDLNQRAAKLRQAGGAQGALKRIRGR